MSTYKLIVSGYGGEITIGSVETDLKVILSEHTDLANCINAANIDWRDIDNQFHFFGPFETFAILLTDENEKDIIQINSEDIFQNTKEFEFKVECDIADINSENNLLMAISLQKGVLFEGTFDAEEFNPEKLLFKTIDNIGIGVGGFKIDRILKTIFYDGEEIMNTGTLAEEKEFTCFINF
jgi:hypothetical protein